MDTIIPSSEKRGGWFLHALAVLIAAAAAIALALFVLQDMVQWVGVPARRNTIESVRYPLGQKYDMFVTNEVSDALDGILAVEKIYWIGRDEKVAPKPNPKCYGETDDPSELQWLLDKAAKLMEGQEIYFNTNIKLMPGTKAMYYLDDTIFAVTWKEGLDFGAYTFAEVKIAHPSQFRRFLANNEFGSDKLFITTEMAASVNAVVASSGDFYRFRQAGTLVYDGTVRRINNGLVDTCYIDNNGDMLFTGVRDYMNMEQAQKFVDDNDINFSIAFGPVLIRDSEMCVPPSYSVGEINDEYSRSALCQLGKLHYMVVTVNKEGQFQYVPTIGRFTRNLLNTGCYQAYALDGGQTAVIAMNNKLINAVMFGFQRKISDIIYFATAIPNG